jgi:hypothetical protein
MPLEYIQHCVDIDVRRGWRNIAKREDTTFDLLTTLATAMAEVLLTIFHDTTTVMVIKG